MLALFLAAGQFLILFVQRVGGRGERNDMCNGWSNVLLSVAWMNDIQRTGQQD